MGTPRVATAGQIACRARRWQLFCLVPRDPLSPPARFFVFFFRLKGFLSLPFYSQPIPREGANHDQRDPSPLQVDPGRIRAAGHGAAKPISRPPTPSNSTPASPFSALPAPDSTGQTACWSAPAALNQASHGEREHPLYLEQYLEQPVEAAIETRLGVRPARSRIIEVGNLACREPGNARLMFAALCRLLCDNALDYVVFTGTAKLRNSFARLRLNPVELALAEAHQVGADASAWGVLPLSAQGHGGRPQPGREVLAQSSLLLNLLGPMPMLLTRPAMTRGALSQ